jgi:hypothetical protein
MAAKKKTPVASPAKKSRKAPKPEGAPVETPTVDTPAIEATPTDVSVIDLAAAAEQVAPADGAESSVGPEAPEQTVVEDAPAEVATEALTLEAETPVPEAPVPLETTLRFWQVRRGQQVVGQTQAGTEEWALKNARKQFGDDVTVEPGRVAPGPKEPSKGPKREKESGQLSALDAAAKVLVETRRPMTCRELIGAMAVKGYWSSPAGKTPAATLYSSMLREATSKGDQARFVKAGKGTFALRQQS